MSAFCEAVMRCILILMTPSYKVCLLVAYFTTVISCGQVLRAAILNLSYPSCFDSCRCQLSTMDQSVMTTTHRC